MEITFCPFTIASIGLQCSNDVSYQPSLDNALDLCFSNYGSRRRRKTFKTNWFDYHKQVFLIFTKIIKSKL